MIVGSIDNPMWLDGLDSVARRIAGSNESPLRVIAGPGTGKTFSLMRRVVRLLEEGVDPSRIMLCTFTRTAARDLQDSLSRLRVPGVDDVVAVTVHSFCFGLLSRADVLPLIGRVPRPLLAFEERFMLEDLRGVNGEGIRALRRRIDAFSAAWARLQRDTPGWPQDRDDHALLGELTAWLRFHYAMLIGELVPEALRFVRDNPTSPCRPSFDHVIVDEYQDLNRAEQVLLDEFARDAAITVVGDEDQSIYSFKYAHPDGIATFHTTHVGTHDENLDRCRRCPVTVVSMANSLIAHNIERSSRRLQASEGNTEGSVCITQWPSMDDEAEGLATYVARQVETRAVDPGRVLVLAPRRQFGYKIRDAIHARGVQAHSFFHEEMLDGNPCRPDESTAQEAFSLLRLLAYPDDRVGLRCWCGFGSSSLRSGAWARIRQRAEETGQSPRVILEQLSSGSIQLPFTMPIVERFALLHTRLETLMGLEGMALVDALFPPDCAWAEPFRSIAEESGQCEEPAELLELIRRNVIQPELPMDVDYVRVMSLHKAKGLTADLVIVAGCVDGLIPSMPRDATLADKLRALEEQRRLFYVAITRTTRSLVLSSVNYIDAADAHRMGAMVRRTNGHRAVTIASRFLGELGPARPEAIPGSDFLRSLQ